MLQTVRAEKIDEKNGVICLVSMFTSWVMVLKLSKKVHFLQFCADSKKKSKSMKINYIYASKCLITYFKEMVFIMLSVTVLEIFGFELEEFC